MASEHKYAFVEPGRERRNRKMQLKTLMKEPAGEERAQQLAQMAREFHENRELNLAMDTGRQSIEDAGGAATHLIDAYMCHERTDHTIEDLAMLADLARWLADESLMRLVRTMAYRAGMAWCSCSDGRERERRIDMLRRRFDTGLADEIDLALL